MSFKLKSGDPLIRFIVELVLIILFSNAIVVGDVSTKQMRSISNLNQLQYHMKPTESIRLSWKYSLRLDDTLEIFYCGYFDKGEPPLIPLAFDVSGTSFVSVYDKRPPDEERLPLDERKISKFFASLYEPISELYFLEINNPDASTGILNISCELRYLSNTDSPVIIGESTIIQVDNPISNHLNTFQLGARAMGIAVLVLLIFGVTGVIARLFYRRFRRKNTDRDLESNSFKDLKRKEKNKKNVFKPSMPDKLKVKQNGNVKKGKESNKKENKSKHTKDPPRIPPPPRPPIPTNKHGKGKLERPPAPQLKKKVPLPPELINKNDSKVILLTNINIPHKSGKPILPARPAAKMNKDKKPVRPPDPLNNKGNSNKLNRPPALGKDKKNAPIPVRPPGPGKVKADIPDRPPAPVKIKAGTPARPPAPGKVKADTPARPPAPGKVKADMPARPLAPGKVKADTPARTPAPGKAKANTPARPPAPSLKADMPARPPAPGKVKADTPARPPALGKIKADKPARPPVPGIIKADTPARPPAPGKIKADTPARPPASVEVKGKGPTRPDQPNTVKQGPETPIRQPAPTVGQTNSKKPVISKSKPQDESLDNFLNSSRISLYDETEEEDSYRSKCSNSTHSSNNSENQNRHSYSTESVSSTRQEGKQFSPPRNFSFEYLTDEDDGTSLKNRSSSMVDRRSSSFEASPATSFFPVDLEDDHSNQCEKPVSPTYSSSNVDVKSKGLHTQYSYSADHINHQNIDQQTRPPLNSFPSEKTTDYDDFPDQYSSEYDFNNNSRFNRRFSSLQNVSTDLQSFDLEYTPSSQ